MHLKKRPFPIFLFSLFLNPRIFSFIRRFGYVFRVTFSSRAETWSLRADKDTDNVVPVYFDKCGLGTAIPTPVVKSDNSSLFRVGRNARFICLSTAPSLLTDPAGKIKANLLNTYACAGLCSRASFASVFFFAGRG